MDKDKENVSKEEKELPGENPHATYKKDIPEVEEVVTGGQAGSPPAENIIDEEE